MATQGACLLFGFEPELQITPRRTARLFPKGVGSGRNGAVVFIFDTHIHHFVLSQASRRQVSLVGDRVVGPSRDLVGEIASSDLKR